MKKDCPYIFISTGELSKEDQICNTAYGFAISGKDGVGMGHNLHILSDEPIKEGDWMYIKEDNGKIWIEQCPKFLGIHYVEKKKIIATTNPELLNEQKKIKVSNSEFSIDVSEYSTRDLLAILQSDIEYIISLYNGKGKVVDVNKLAEKMLEAYHDYKAEGFSEYQNGKFIGIIDGYNQCLQDNADKKFTLEDAKRIYNTGRQDVLESQKRGEYFEMFDEVVTSLTKEQPQKDTVMVEYEEHLVDRDGNDPQHEDRVEGSIFKPKLKDGCIVIVKN